MALEDIQVDVARILTEAGRAPGAAKLIAVSKVQPNARVEAVLQAGHRSFGENRVQEAQGKWPDFKAQFEGVDLHLIGPLQSNKVRPAMELFDAIHTVDREKLARRIADMAQELGHCPDLFIQVNTGAEPTCRCRCLYPNCARDGFAAERFDVHPARGRGAKPAFRPFGQDCCAKRAFGIVDGNERRL